VAFLLPIVCKPIEAADLLQSLLIGGTLDNLLGVCLINSAASIEQSFCRERVPRIRRVGR
jgi:hypothetical protein